MENNVFYFIFVILFKNMFIEMLITEDSRLFFPVSIQSSANNSQQ